MIDRKLTPEEVAILLPQVLITIEEMQDGKKKSDEEMKDFLMRFSRVEGYVPIVKDVKDFLDGCVSSKDVPFNSCIMNRSNTIKDAVAASENAVERMINKAVTNAVFKGIGIIAGAVIVFVLAKLGLG